MKADFGLLIIAGGLPLLLLFNIAGPAAAGNGSGNDEQKITIRVKAGNVINEVSAGDYHQKIKRQKNVL